MAEEGETILAALCARHGAGIDRDTKERYGPGDCWTMWLFEGCDGRGAEEVDAAMSWVASNLDGARRMWKGASWLGEPVRAHLATAHRGGGLDPRREARLAARSVASAFAALSGWGMGPILGASHEEPAPPGLADAVSKGFAQALGKMASKAEFDALEEAAGAARSRKAPGL